MTRLEDAIDDGLAQLHRSQTDRITEIAVLRKHLRTYLATVFSPFTLDPTYGDAVHRLWDKIFPPEDPDSKDGT